MVGAGVLPACIYNGELHFLFGKEQAIDENQGWSDFGGGVDEGESPLQGAAREGTEETSGFLGSVESMKERLAKGTVHLQWKQYHTFVFKLDHDPSFPFYFNNNQRLLRSRLNPKSMHETTIFEKAQIRWVPLREVRQMHKKRVFRDFYNNVVAMLLTPSMLQHVGRLLRQKGKRTHRQQKQKRRRTHRRH